MAAAGHPTDPLTFFFGSTGGGVWKTSNAGVHWQNVSDGYFRTASVGALAVAESDPNVLYAGMGECCLRGNVSPGDGVYRSEDCGRSWQRAGLEETRHIGAIRVDPRNARRLYVAALGHAFGSNPERGVFRSEDGGSSWSLVLTGGQDAGAVDLTMDPVDPAFLFASLWKVRRKPWRLDSGGEGSGLYRSSDGGDSWEDVTPRLGLAPGPIGKIGVAISPARTRRVWAIVEAQDGGLFRSDDRGESWERVSERADLGARAFYYMHLTPHPSDHETLFVMNHLLWKSTNGGRDFVAVASPHPDHHTLWIDPASPTRMILGCDGGAAISLDAGDSWSSVFNQPTGEMYHVTTDSRFPYRVYGAQQDNSTISLPSRSDDLGIGAREWYDVGGSESGYVAVREDDPDIVYAGSSGFGEGGRITRYNHRLRQRRDISPWPHKTGGLPASEYKYRFQWTAPIVLSPHDSSTLYCGANRLFRTQDEGESWEIVSPDLTRNDPEKQQSSGGPIAPDNSGVEVYCTIFAVAESPAQGGVIWAGSDDGRVHLSRDNGSTWSDVTPSDLPEWALISIIEPSALDPARAYVAATRYKLDDRTPYLFKTVDGGMTWTTITDGIDTDDYTRVIREDPECPRLLFCGTETGVYVSTDEGTRWSRLTLGLPAVPVHDLAIRDGDLIAATHGRSFWILDDLGPLRAHARNFDVDARQRPTLYPPKTAYRFALDTLMYLPKEQETDHPVTVQVLPSANVFYLQTPPTPGDAPVLLDAGENPPRGAVFQYFLDQAYDDLRLEIHGPEGELVAVFSGATSASARDDKQRPSHELTLEATPGAHRVVWDLRCAGARPVPPKAGRQCAPLVAPGDYMVALSAGQHCSTQQLCVALDPRSESTPEEAREQSAFQRALRDQLSRVNRAVAGIRKLYRDIDYWTARIAADGGETLASLSGLRAELASLEDRLVQGALTHQGNIGAHPRLSDQIVYLFEVAESADRRPTTQAQTAYVELAGEVDEVFSALERTLRGLEGINTHLTEVGGAPLEWHEDQEPMENTRQPLD